MTDDGFDEEGFAAFLAACRVLWAGDAPVVVERDDDA